MALYTVVFSFRGTPVIRQVKAGTSLDALTIWAKQADLPESKKPEVSLTEAIVGEKLTAAKGLINVWSACLSLGNEVGVVVISVTQIDNVYPMVIEED